MDGNGRILQKKLDAAQKDVLKKKRLTFLPEVISEHARNVENKHIFTGKYEGFIHVMFAVKSLIQGLS